MIGTQWRRQRELKTKDIPEQEMFYNQIVNIQDEVEQVLMVMAYLTAGRISEITPKKFLYKTTYAKEERLDSKTNTMRFFVKRNENGSPVTEAKIRIPLDYPGIKKSNIIFKEELGKQIMVIAMQNRKNKKYTTKNLPIPVFKEEKFVSIIRNYLDKLQLEQPLFPFQDWRARLIINKYGYNPHFLRDIRLTHMVTIYSFDAFQLTKFAGWKNVSPSERYIRLGTRDLVRNY